MNSINLINSIDVKICLAQFRLYDLYRRRLLYLLGRILLDCIIHISSIEYVYQGSQLKRK